MVIGTTIKAIQSLPTSVWINAEFPNGIGVANPTSGTKLITIESIDGSGVNGSISGLDITGVKWYASGGVDNKPYFHIQESDTETFYIPGNANMLSGVNYGHCYLIVCSDNTQINGFGACMTRGASGVGAHNINLYGYQTASSKLVNEWAGVNLSLKPYSNTPSDNRKIHCAIFNVRGNGLTTECYSHSYYGSTSTGSTSTGVLNSNVIGHTVFGIRYSSGVLSGTVSAKEKFKLYEFIQFKRELSNGEIKLVQAYLKAKYNI